MASLSEKLSASFSLGELCASSSAERNPALKALQDNPPDSVVANLRYLAQKALQPVRTMLSVPLIINSGYRHPDVNKLIGASTTSQHCQGEAADCKLLPEFLYKSSAAFIRQTIADQVHHVTGCRVRSNVSENYYLFAYVALNLEKLDVDQLIHEYGTAKGSPAWVHIAASQRQNKRQILAVGTYTGGSYVSMNVTDALKLGTD